MTTLIAVGAVIVLIIGLIVWFVRRRGRTAFIRGGSNRQPRLAVLDAAAVDERRRLVLVRRDNVEHLLMIGGPSDIVVERGIGRAARPAPEVTAGHPAASKGPQPLPQAPPLRPEQQAAGQQLQSAATESMSAAPGLPGNPPREPQETRARPNGLKATAPPPPVPEPAPQPQKQAEAPAPVQTGIRPADKPQGAAAPVTAAAVSSSAASAADRMAGLETESRSQLGPVSTTEAEETNAAPVVVAETPAAKPVDAPEGENVVAAELEDIFDATNELGSSAKDAEPGAAEKDETSPQANGMETHDDVPEVSVGSDGEDTADAGQPPVMTAEELIADFDELLEAEISKARQQKPGVHIPETDAGHVGPPTMQSLEDEMKKLLGDLNVKQ